MKFAALGVYLRTFQTDARRNHERQAGLHRPDCCAIRRRGHCAVTMCNMSEQSTRRNFQDDEQPLLSHNLRSADSQHMNREVPPVSNRDKTNNSLLPQTKASRDQEKKLRRNGSAVGKSAAASVSDRIPP